jgi:hypothetical protein
LDPATIGVPRRIKDPGVLGHGEAIGRVYVRTARHLSGPLPLIGRATAQIPRRDDIRRHTSLGRKAYCGLPAPHGASGRRFAGTLAAIAVVPLLAFGAGSSAQTGGQLFASACGGCHDDVAHPRGLVYNAAGNAAVIQAVIARGMSVTASLADLTSIAAYLDSAKPTVATAAVAANPIATKLSIFDVIVSAAESHADWKIIQRIETVTPPKKGTVTYKVANGFARPSFATYTPFPGQSGIDTWTYRGIGPDEATSTTIRTASVMIAGGSPPNYQGLWWNYPANSESGWGVNLAHQGDTIFASWFTYDTSGKAWWLVATLDKSTSAANTYSGKLYSTRGPAFSANPWDPLAVMNNEQGAATFAFTDANNGTFRYVIGAIDQTKTITREVFGTLPTCTFGAADDPAAAINYQDLWWKKPASAESGWGINLNHQDDTIFATWFTYDVDGSPLWLVVTADKKSPGVYSGDLYRTAGARFDAFKPGDVTSKIVGTAKFTVVDGNTITFDYTVQLAGMVSAVTQSKAITREIFMAPGTTCR